jgi:ESCRT-I complex subunit VPS37
MPLQRYTPQFLLMRLKHSITAQDDASEALATAFVRQATSGNTSSGTGTPAPNNEIDDFVKEFKELRKVYHKRVLWAEKWSKGDVVWREDY